MKNSDIILSVIIPVYNSEKYILNCINSIITSRNMSFEIICVDDGSSDNSRECILSIDDCRVKYIYKINGGVSSARNVGIKAAKGKYISFVDSDDYVDASYIDSILKCIEKGKISLVLFGHCNFNGNYKIIKKQCSTINELYKLACEQRLNAPWDKVFCKEIIDKHALSFDENMKTSEDGDFFVKYLYYVDRMKVIDKILYYYRINPEGAVQRPKIDYIYDQNKMLQRIIHFVKKKNLSTDDYLIDDVAIERMFYLIANLIRNGVKTYQIENALLDSGFMNIIALHKLSLKGKIKFYILKLRQYKFTCLIVR